MSDPVNRIVKNIPFAELVYKAALAIAEGQQALDLNSCETAQLLADMKLDPHAVILAIVEVTDEDGKVIKYETLDNDEPMSLLAYGVTPTFYQFTETTIDLKFWVHWYLRSYHAESKSSRISDYEKTWETSRGTYGGGGGFRLNLGLFSIGGGGGGKKSWAKGQCEVNLSVRTHSAYDQQVHGLSASAACRLVTILKPKPAPARAIPLLTTRVETTPV